MRTVLTAPNIPGVDGNRVLRVELDLDADSEPISGRIRGWGIVAREFRGALELIELLDQARDAEQPGGAPSAPALRTEPGREWHPG
jgi:hypothetical protein